VKKKQWNCVFFDMSPTLLSRPVKHLESDHSEDVTWHDMSSWSWSIRIWALINNHKTFFIMYWLCYLWTWQMF